VSPSQTYVACPRNLGYEDSSCGGKTHRLERDRQSRHIISCLEELLWDLESLATGHMSLQSVLQIA